MMIRGTYRAIAAVTWLAGTLTLAGCAATSPRVDYYTLSPADLPALQGAAAAGCDRIPISVGPVAWPRYLDQPRIVTRTGPNTLEFDEFNRWAGSLRDDFERALRKNLSALLQSERISDYGGSARYRTRYRVEVDVEQFDGALGGEVILDAKWAVFARDSGDLVGLPHASAIRTTAPGAGYAALASASSEAVAELSREIAAELAGICANPPD